MDTVTLELHNELADWLKEIAEKRGLDLYEAAQQLLEEQRMRDHLVTRIEVPIGNCRWAATIPMRGLIYSGYETNWQRVAPDRTADSATS